MKQLGAFAILFIAALPTLPPAEGSQPKQLEIFSRLGGKANVKIYSGESVTFRVREASSGLEDLFAPTQPLHGVTFVLREWPIIRQDAIATVKGANRRVVREQKPEPELWGIPPSSFTVRGGAMVGRYKLTAKKPGYQSAKILIYLARFEIVDIDARLTEKVYRASFDIRLLDPSEEGRAIPILIESLNFDGKRIDWRNDIVLAPVMLEPDLYRSSRRISLSSQVVEGLAERVARAKEDPLPPGFFDMKPLRIVEGGTLRVSFREMQAVYPLPLGY